MKICSIQECKAKLYARGYCNKHYQRWLRHGDAINGRTRASKGELLDWVLHQALGHAREDCILWPFGKNGKGYGVLTAEGRKWRAHRLVCDLAHGAPPTDKHQAAHSCGKRDCCNPRHLRWATSFENEHDKRLHGTVARGEKNGSAKITTADVLDIRADSGSGLSHREVAEKYGISQGHVGDILNGRKWAWLSVPRLTSEQSP